MRKARLLVLGLAALLAAGAAQAQDVIINEILYDGDGGDEGMFTELLGAPGTPLDGYALVGVNGNGGADYATIPLDGYVIPGDGYFVVGQDATVAEADLIDPAADWQNGADAVELRLNDAAVDIICYGGSEDLTCEGDPGPDVSPGSSTARCPDGQDTDNNAEDLAEDPTPTPGAMNDADCGPVEPTDYTVCEIMEVDADGFPVHYGEYVHIVDPVVSLNDNLTYATNRAEIAVTDGQCCTYLFDYDVLDAYPAGTVFDVVGVVDFYNGKTEVTDLELTVLGDDVVPEPYEITTGELAANGEDYESCLVWICGLEIIEGTWPDEGSSTNLTVDDGSGPVVLRIDSDTDIDGSPAPVQPFTAIGIAGQYDPDSPFFDGYQFLPRNLDDIIEEDCPEPTATKRATWGQIKSTYNR
ncbi:MAG: hypothetical protein GF355_10070 [Candidatus Eisenbacteria bacterium]|nr:hypothetical protein [Candidatus Eisenbacteria bacterium]